MPELDVILAEMPLPPENAETAVWTNNFEEQLKIAIRTWPMLQEDPGTANDFVNTLEAQLNGHPRNADNEYRLLVLLEFYRYFYYGSKLKFESQEHEEQFLGANGLRDAIGKTIERQYFRPVMLNAAQRGLDGIEALGRFPRRPLLTMILDEQTELFKAVFEAPEPDAQEHTNLAKNLIIGAINNFFLPQNVQRNKAILLINYLKCLARVAPFQAVSREVWDNCLLHGVAVAGGVGGLVGVVSVQFIPRLETPEEPVHAPLNILQHAMRAREQLLKVLKQYDQELYDTISPCEIHIQIATPNIAAQIQGASITLFIALIILMQATGVVWQAIDDVGIVVTGDLDDNGVIRRVRDVDIKTSVALEKVTIGQQKRLLMLVPEENRADARKGLEAWPNPPILAVLHSGEPRIALEGESPSVEIISYRDLTHLLLSRCLLDFPGLVNFVSEKRYEAWDEQERYRFFQILMDTAPELIEFEIGSKGGTRSLRETIKDEWLSRQPIFLNEQGWKKVEDMKSLFDNAEKLIGKGNYEQSLNILNELQQRDDIGYFWKKKSEKLIKQIEAEQEKSNVKAEQEKLEIEAEQDKLNRLREVVHTACSALSPRKALKVIDKVVKSDIPEDLKEELQKQQEKSRETLMRQGKIAALITSGVIFMLILGTILFMIPPPPLIPPDFDVTATKTSVIPGHTSSLSVTVANPSGLPLEYEWKAEYGQVKPLKSSPTVAEYTAPRKIVEDTVILKVKSNGREIFTSKPIKISVTPYREGR
ncbi:hypothetical protein FJZ31_14985 [Candidatus Poribacteria bacterium]|nr:hypothetical protein [Candidatus Poribacteria bacterium]